MKLLKTFLIISLLCPSIWSIDGVKNIWVSNSRWVNSKTPATFSNSAITLAGADNENDEAKAKAVYYQLLRMYGHGGGNIQEGPKGNEYTISDAWLQLHNGVKGLCDMHNRALAALWMGYKNNWTNSIARKVNTTTIVFTSGQHTQAALYYKDDDNTSRFHLFDSHLGFFAYTKDTTRIASPEELDNDLTILTEPKKIPKPFFIRCTFPPEIMNPVKTHPEFNANFGNPSDYSFTYNSSVPAVNYNTDFNLRKGESLKRCWYNDGVKVPYSQSEQGSNAFSLYEDNTEYTIRGVPKDPVNYKAMRPYMETDSRRLWGNGYHVYTPELINDKFSTGAMSANGLVSGNPGAGEPALHASVIGTEAQVTYQMQGIYRIAESFIEGEYYLKSAGGITIELSVDSGGSWETVWSAGTLESGKKSFSVDIGKLRWLANKSTTFNLGSSKKRSGSSWQDQVYYGYRYRVRIKISAESNVKDVGIASLTFKDTYMFNKFMLPTLLPGQNVVTVEGDELSESTAVKIEYVWEESGAEKSQVSFASSLPHTFTINVQESDTLKVKCKYFTVSAVNASAVDVRNFPKTGWHGNKKIGFYPNPGVTGQIINFMLPGPRYTGLQVYNHKGQLVRHFTGSGSSVIWDTRNMKGNFICPGMYLVRAHYGGGILTGRVSILE
ncbi:MAG: T9SS type A sorting domain-containing protein [bacterium]